MEDYKNSKEYQMDLEIEAQYYTSDNIDNMIDLVVLGYEHSLRILRHRVPCYSEKRFEEARETVLKAQFLVNADPNYYGEIFGGFRPDVVHLAQDAEFIKAIDITTDQEKNL